MRRTKANRRHATLEAYRGIFCDLLGALLLLVVSLIIISLLSFHPQDRSWFTITNEPIRNQAGIVGSYTAAFLLELFGLSSIAILIGFTFIAISLFRRLKLIEWLVSSFASVLMILSASLCAGLIAKKFNFHGTEFSTGGFIGNIFALNTANYLNAGGAACLLAFLLLCTLSLSTRLSIRDLSLYSWWGITKLSILSAAFVIILGSYTLQLLQFLFKKLHFISRTISAIRKAFKAAFAQKISIPNTKKNLWPRLWHWLDQLARPERGRNKAIINNQKTIPVESLSVSSFGTITPQIIIEDKSAPSVLDRIQSITRNNDRKMKSLITNPTEFQLPPIQLLHSSPNKRAEIDKSEIYSKSKVIEEKLADFKIDGNITAVKPGPVITVYEFKPGTGVKLSAITSLADDLALATSAASVRIEAPIPGRDVVGIEVPNTKRESVFLRELIQAEEFLNKSIAIPIAMGKDTMGNPVISDLKRTPHMLVAGATGSGKSVYINTLICSLLYRFTPAELRLIMVDPKQLELSTYQDIPHLLLPVVTDSKQASQALRWAVTEMEERYQQIARSGMRDIDGYNQKLNDEGSETMAKRIGSNFDEEILPMPKIVIIIDELADLMMTSKSDVETSICRLAQKARAAGIHLVLATQRPSVDVITGLIKANLPTRLSFRLSSKNDSRTIFDTGGAERLVGNGDMLFMPPGESRLVRMHGAYISESEIESIAEHWRNQASPEYREDILLDEATTNFGSLDSLAELEDNLYEDALDLALSTGYVSASMLQRRFRIGYNRAARLVEAMEARGIVGPADGSKPRPVIFSQSPEA